MGTGKTKTCIWALRLSQAHRPRQLDAGGGAAVDARLHLGQGDLPHHAAPDGAGADRRRRARRTKLLPQKDVDIYIVNHDGVKVIFKELMQRPDIDCICFDEAAAYRNARAERSKVARKLTKRPQVCLGHDRIADAIGTDRCLRTGAPDHTRHGAAFVGAVPAGHHDQRLAVPLGAAQGRRTRRCRRSCSPRCASRLDEIVELPTVIVREIDVPMGTRQKQVYDALRDHASALLKEGTITASNGGVVFSKMLQAIASAGSMRDDDRKIIRARQRGHAAGAARHHRVGRAQGHRVLAVQVGDGGDRRAR